MSKIEVDFYILILNLDFRLQLHASLDKPTLFFVLQQRSNLEKRGK